MEVHRFCQTELSHAEREALAHLSQRAERALESGTISREERDDLLRAIYADGKVSVEECAILRQLQERIWQGEVAIVV